MLQQHLLPLLQGESLKRVFEYARSTCGLTALDLNGVVAPTPSTKSGSVDPVIDAALPLVDILHVNEDEVSTYASASDIVPLPKLN